jgi:hypothetical protein
MADVRIRNVRKWNRSSAHEHITHVGNIIDANWIWTRESVIESIDAGSNTFYVYENSRRSEVGVVRPAGYLPYLRTHADGYWNDNLLSLPEC